MLPQQAPEPRGCAPRGCDKHTRPKTASASSTAGPHHLAAWSIKRAKAALDCGQPSESDLFLRSRRDIGTREEVGPRPPHDDDDDDDDDDDGSCDDDRDGEAAVRCSRRDLGTREEADVGAHPSRHDDCDGERRCVGCEEG